jgi:hypothetical protein
VWVLSSSTKGKQPYLCKWALCVRMVSLSGVLRVRRITAWEFRSGRSLHLLCKSALYNHAGSTIEVLNSTFAGSTTYEKRIHNEVGGSLTPSNTGLTNSFSGDNCVGEPVLDAGYNIDSGASCRFTQATGSLSNTDPLLDPAGLQDNGGLTQTLALQPDSPAVDLVGEGACPLPRLTRQQAAVDKVGANTSSSVSTSSLVKRTSNRRRARALFFSSSNDTGGYS